MFDFLRRIPAMLNRKKKAAGSAHGKPPAGPAAVEGSASDASEARGGPDRKPRRPKSPSQRRSGPKPKSGGGTRSKRKK